MRIRILNTGLKDQELQDSGAGLHQLDDDAGHPALADSLQLLQLRRLV